MPLPTNAPITGRCPHLTRSAPLQLQKLNILKANKHEAHTENVLRCPSQQRSAPRTVYEPETPKERLLRALVTFRLGTREASNACLPTADRTSPAKVTPGVFVLQQATVKRLMTYFLNIVQHKLRSPSIFDIQARCLAAQCKKQSARPPPQMLTNEGVLPVESQYVRIGKQKMRETIGLLLQMSTSPQGVISLQKGLKYLYNVLKITDLSQTKEVSSSTASASHRNYLQIRGNLPLMAQSPISSSEYTFRAAPASFTLLHMHLKPKEVTRHSAKARHARPSATWPTSLNYAVHELIAGIFDALLGLQNSARSDQSSQQRPDMIKQTQPSTVRCHLDEEELDVRNSILILRPTCLRNGWHHSDLPPKSSSWLPSSAPIASDCQCLLQSACRQPHQGLRLGVAERCLLAVSKLE